jgi:hypothetical protein
MSAHFSRFMEPLIVVLRSKQLALRGPTRLEWLLHAKAREAINEAVVHAKALCEDLDLVVDCFATKTGGCTPSRYAINEQSFDSNVLGRSLPCITPLKCRLSTCLAVFVGPTSLNTLFFPIYYVRTSLVLTLAPQIRQGPGKEIPVRARRMDTNGAATCLFPRAGEAVISKPTFSSVFRPLNRVLCRAIWI